MNKTLKSESFIYWLQGFFEISEATTLNEKQINIIKEHLELCFEKVVSSAPQGELSKLGSPTLTPSGPGKPFYQRLDLSGHIKYDPSQSITSVIC